MKLMQRRATIAVAMTLAGVASAPAPIEAQSRNGPGVDTPRLLVAVFQSNEPAIGVAVAVAVEDKVNVFDPVTARTVAPTGMFGLPLMRMPATRAEVLPLVSVTALLPEVVLTAIDPEFTVTPEPASQRNPAVPAALATIIAKAIEKDPGYAQAYAGLADSHILLGVFGDVAPGDAHLHRA